MPSLAIIGGTGLNQWSNWVPYQQANPETLYGVPSAPIALGMIGSQEVAFLPRHGHPHKIPPHQINYRANIAALKALGVERIIAVNAVGGIHPDMGPQALVLPDQLIDYSWGRNPTFSGAGEAPLKHIDFTEPYSASIRRRIEHVASQHNIGLVNYGVYGCTQGPRLETAAEINKLERDGVDIVGMTGMPEATMARELDIEYAALALVVNWAAGRDSNVIKMATIEHNLEQGMGQVTQLLNKVIDDFSKELV